MYRSRGAGKSARSVTSDGRREKSADSAAPKPSVLWWWSQKRGTGCFIPLAAISRQSPGHQFSCVRLVIGSIVNKEGV